MDCNNFFVSCERVFRPDLQNKPVIVLSNNDGCAISRSNEVKALGIPMGAPLFQIKKLLDEHQTTIFSSNFSLYGDISARVMDTIEALVPKLEIYSIDEAFIDFTGINNIPELAHKVRQQIATCIGIPTCIGVAPTKTLAKVANHLAKKNLQLNGVCVLKDESDIDMALRTLDVNDIWGIGRKISERLIQQRIYTAYDLKRTDPRWIRQHFTIVAERIFHELNGVPCLSVETTIQPRKSIQVSRSFANKVKDFETLRMAIATYATRMGEKLRYNKLKTNNLMVSICTNRFQKENQHYSNSILVHLPLAINDDSGLIKASIQGLRSVFKSGYEYNKVGVMALDLIPESQTQVTLFDQPEQKSLKNQQLSSTLDKINKRYGRGTVHIASCTPKLRWQDNKEKKSPSFTTSWDDIPKVFAK